MKEGKRKIEKVREGMKFKKESTKAVKKTNKGCKEKGWKERYSEKGKE